MSEKQQSVILKIGSNYYTLTPAEKKLADYILANQETVAGLSISRLASICDVAEATVSRFSRHMGFRGYPALKLAVANAVAQSRLGDNPLTGEITRTDSLETVAQKLFRTNTEAMSQTMEVLNLETVSLVAAELEARGYAQYEISNFACSGGESRHNLLYWQDEEYLGIGPAAHSFLNGRRFYYPRDLQAFLAGTPPVDDGPGGSFGEFIMLGLRLSAGISHPQAARFPGGEALFDSLYAAARALAAQQPPQAPLLRLGPASIALTRRGFLVSNAVIGALLEALPDTE